MEEVVSGSRVHGGLLLVHPVGLNTEIKKNLMYSMRRLRAVEETIAAKYSEWKMRCPVHLSTGQEAVSAAAGAVLTAKDYAVSGHRAHTHYLSKGGSLVGMLAEIYGKKSGCSSGKGGSMHLIDEAVGFMGSTAIVGSTIPVGTGLGLAQQLSKTGHLSVVYLGDGACEEGAFFESANFAVLKKLPVLFICENNFYSVYSHLRVRQPEGRRLFEMARGIGMESAFCDGNDVEASYLQLKKFADEARAGEGPRFVELVTYRWREHCGPNFDNDIGYRTEAEYLQWKEKDPIANYEKKLLSENVLSREDLQTMDKKIEKEVLAAFEEAGAAPFPEANEYLTHLYDEECPR